MSEEICRRIKAAIEDEQKAVDEYTELSMKIRYTKRPDMSPKFTHIAMDEGRHHDTLKMIFDHVCPTGV